MVFCSAQQLFEQVPSNYSNKHPVTFGHIFARCRAELKVSKPLDARSKNHWLVGPQITGCLVHKSLDVLVQKSLGTRSKRSTTKTTNNATMARRDNGDSFCLLLPRHSLLPRTALVSLIVVVVVLVDSGGSMQVATTPRTALLASAVKWSLVCSTHPLTFLFLFHWHVAVE